MAFIQARFTSNALKRNVRFNVILPSDPMLLPGMEAPKGPFKTIYLLHGYTGSLNGWLLNAELGDIPQLYDTAIVMPDGENHFYVDAHKRHDDYSRFISEELVEFTRAMFPLSHKREDTAIGGISMGGYGSLYNGMRYSDTFGHIIAISPANIIHELKDSSEEPNNVGASRGYYEGVFGDLDKANETELNLRILASRLKAEGKEFPSIYLACGWNDMLHAPNKAFHEHLVSLGVDHVWREGPGSHLHDFFYPHLKEGIAGFAPALPEKPNPFWVDHEEE